jgi:hypothetical protein
MQVPIVRGSAIIPIGALSLLAGELETGPEWLPIARPPRFPEIPADVEPWRFIEILLDYYFRQAQDGDPAFKAWIPPDAAMPPGVFRSGPFLFPNLAVPALLMPLLDFFDRLDAETDRIIEWAKVSDEPAAAVLLALIAAPLSPLWTMGFFDPLIGGNDGLIAERDGWLARKAEYRAVVISEMARDPWSPSARLAELLLEPGFMGWHPIGSKWDRGVQTVPDFCTPVILYRAINGAAELWSANVVQLVMDIGNAAADALDNGFEVLKVLARALQWVAENPFKTGIAVVGGLAVGGVIATAPGRLVGRVLK